MSPRTPSVESRVAAVAVERRVEQTIATSRVMLSGAGVLTIWMVSKAPDWSPAVLPLALVYAAFALAVLLTLPALRRVTWGAVVAIHLTDIAAAGLFTLLTDGPDGVSFTFLSYPLLTAAARWGLYETLSTAATAVVLIAFEVRWVFDAWLGTQPPGLAGFMGSLATLRTASLLAIALVVGYLSDAEKRRRAEALSVTRMLRAVRVGDSVESAFDDVLRETQRVFDAKRVVLIAQEHRTGRTYLWETPASPGSTAFVEIGREDGHRCLVPLPGVGAYVWRRGFGRGWGLVAVDEQGASLGTAGTVLPAEWPALPPFRRAVVATLPFDARWMTRVFVLDVPVLLEREEAARTAQRIIIKVGPALYQHYQLRRIRERAARTERARIVRELHDGPVQSLLGVDMELAVLRRSARERAPQLDADLARFHEAVKHEVVSLREVFEGVRAGTGPSRAIQQDLAEMTRRFAVYTGIDARFASEHPGLTLPPTPRRELLRVVHEALVNVRKHSRARRVVVASRIQADDLLVRIEDSGCGFPWAGVRTGEELRASGAGPWAMLDRLGSFGGTLVITSRPGQGATVEISCPLPERVRALA